MKRIKNCSLNKETAWKRFEKKNANDKRKSLAGFNMCIVHVWVCNVYGCNAETVVRVWVYGYMLFENSSIVPPQWRSCLNVCTISWSVFILKLHTTLAFTNKHLKFCPILIESSNSNEQIECAPVAVCITHFRIHLDIMRW